jgi:hypothetical protein
MPRDDPRRREQQPHRGKRPQPEQRHAQDLPPVPLVGVVAEPAEVGDRGGREQGHDHGVAVQDVADLVREDRFELRVVEPVEQRRRHVQLRAAARQRVGPAERRRRCGPRASRAAGRLPAAPAAGQPPRRARCPLRWRGGRPGARCRNRRRTDRRPRSRR